MLHLKYELICGDETPLLYLLLQGLLKTKGQGN
jgi:hypothetical protein